MADFYIDSLVLEVPGLSQVDSQHLAFEIATGLGAQGSVLKPREIPGMQVEILTGETLALSELGRRIVAEILSEIRRLP